MKNSIRTGLKSWTISVKPHFPTFLRETISVCIWLYTVCIYSLHAPVIKCSSTNLLFLCDGCVCVCLQWIAWIPCAQVAVCVCAVSVCVQQAGEMRAVRRHFLPVKEQCSGHGTYQAQTVGCVCEQGWSGDDCSVGEYQSKHTDIQCASFFLSSYHF